MRRLRVHFVFLLNFRECKLYQLDIMYWIAMVQRMVGCWTYSLNRRMHALWNGNSYKQRMYILGASSYSSSTIPSASWNEACSVWRSLVWVSFGGSDINIASFSFWVIVHRTDTQQPGDWRHINDWCGGTIAPLKDNNGCYRLRSGATVMAFVGWKMSNDVLYEMSRRRETIFHLNN